MTDNSDSLSEEDQPEGDQPDDEEPGCATGFRGGQVPAERIDESTRQVFARGGREYDDLCDRLFADDPVFSYRSGDDLKL